MGYVFAFLTVHLVIIILLAVPFVLFVVPAIKKKKKILFFVAVPFIILPYLPYESRAFWGYKITNECRIKKHLFQKKYYLADEKGKMLADGALNGQLRMSIFTVLTDMNPNMQSVLFMIAKRNKARILIMTNLFRNAKDWGLNILHVLIIFILCKTVYREHIRCKVNDE